MAGLRDAVAPAGPYRRGMWALGDYHRFALQTVWGLGPVLVEACGVSAGQRVLDVAAGTGNVAIRAAETGADVVASDITPQHFEAGGREAAGHGVELDWVRADAQALPFGDGEFDVVCSVFGAMFAADHQAVADEMVRVCRPGGTVGMINFAPVGVAGSFFELIAAYAPPDDAPPPILWGDEAHVRSLFRDRLDPLRLTRGAYVERSPGDAASYCAFFNETFGPLIALHAALDAERAAALDRDFLAFAERANHAPPGAPAEYRYEYLLVVGAVN
jgi:ubiquinone/menaquinone biosynthesis C-methylase UbiE